MGSVGNTVTTLKSPVDEFSSLPKAYNITRQLNISKNQEDVFREMRMDASRIVDNLDEDNKYGFKSADPDYRNWGVQISSDKIYMSRHANLKAIQQQINEWARRRSARIRRNDPNYSNERYEHDMKVAYIMQASLNRYKDLHKDIIS